MSDLSDEELDRIEKRLKGAASGGPRVSRDTAADLLAVVAEVRRRRAEKPKGTAHELTLEEKVGTEEK